MWFVILVFYLGTLKKNSSQLRRTLSKMDAQGALSSRRNNSSNGLSTPALDDHSLQAETREAGMFGVIAALSFLLNSLFCVIMMKKPAMLKRPHNILLFSLAITDLLTGLQLYENEFNRPDVYTETSQFDYIAPGQNILLLNTSQVQLCVEKQINKTKITAHLRGVCSRLLLLLLCRLLAFPGYDPMDVILFRL